MSLIAETSLSDGRSGDRRRTSPLDAATTCAVWAGAGEFGEYVVYERDGRWTFAAGVRSRIVLTSSTVTVTQDGEEASWSWLDDPSTPDPATALGAAANALRTPGWHLYGRVAFDFCASTRGLADRVAAGAELAHLIVPEIEMTVVADGSTSIVEPGDTATDVLDRLMAHLDDHRAGEASLPVPVDTDDHGYVDQVAAAVAEIREGRYEKVIMSRQVDIPFAVDMPATYARARAANRPMRSYLLSLDGAELAGFSPELVAAVDTDGVVVTEPLAGTRRAGVSPEADEAAKQDLLSDGKEITEHAVSVRACFGEIESISEPETTAVTEFMAVRQRGVVQHLASTVRGRLAADADAWRALGVLFPSITASGIPKAPALEAIYRLEPRPRGAYSGAVIAATADGELDAALILRSVYAEGGRAWLRSGAGVVAQSRPEREFTETCEKLAGLAPHIVPAESRSAE